jgi:hypothetical protein
VQTKRLTHRVVLLGVDDRLRRVAQLPSTFDRDATGARSVELKLKSTETDLVEFSPDKHVHRQVSGYTVHAQQSG